MRYQHHRSSFRINTIQFLHNLFRILLIQCTRRLIRKNHLRLINQTTTNAGSLQLTTGNLIHIIFRNITDSQLVHQFLRPLINLLTAFLTFLRLISRQYNIIKNTQIFQHIHLLENKSHLIQSQITHFFCLQAADILPKEIHLPRSNTIHPAHCIQKCRLPGSTRPHNSRHLPLLHLQIHIPKHIILSLIHNISLTQILHFQTIHNPTQPFYFLYLYHSSFFSTSQCLPFSPTPSYSLPANPPS